MSDPFERALRAAPKPATATDPRSYCPHTPHPKQALFLSLDCLEAGYGGAAGGGKSDALLMGALQYVNVPSYAALVLRRTYADLALPGAIMDRSHEWLAGTDASWNGTDKRWTFPSGASLSFGYLDTDRDRFRYASAEFQFVGFDELTQFPERWYLFLFSRLRKARGVDIPLRVRSATNPGGIGHEWVRRRFLSGAADAPPFIPASLDDNPSIDADGYRASLAQLDPGTRAQLLNGVWIRDSGGLVYQPTLATVVPAAPHCTSTVLALDFGFVDATAFAILGWCEKSRRVYVLRSWKVEKKTPGEIGEMCRALEDVWKFDAIVGDLGGLGKGYAEEARRRFHVPIEAAEKKNKRGYIDLLNGALANGELVVVAGENDALLREWAELPWTDDRSKESDGFDNHLADAVLYGWRRCLAYSETPDEPSPPRGTPEWQAAEEAAAVEAHDSRQKREWWEGDAPKEREWWER